MHIETIVILSCYYCLFGIRFRRCMEHYDKLRERMTQCCAQNVVKHHGESLNRDFLARKINIYLVAEFKLFSSVVTDYFSCRHFNASPDPFISSLISWHDPTHTVD